MANVLIASHWTSKDASVWYKALQTLLKIWLKIFRKSDTYINKMSTSSSWTKFLKYNFMILNFKIQPFPPILLCLSIDIFSGLWLNPYKRHLANFTLIHHHHLSLSLGHLKAIKKSSYRAESGICIHRSPTTSHNVNSSLERSPAEKSTFITLRVLYEIMNSQLFANYNLLESARWAKLHFLITLSMIVFKEFSESSYKIFVIKRDRTRHFL